MPTPEPFIEVRDLTIRFGRDAASPPVVDRFDMRIHDGEVLALVGESGSGKTIVSRALLGLLPDQARIVAGDITVAGRRLAGFSRGELLKYRGEAVGMVFQEPLTSLNPALRIGEQLDEGLRLHTGLAPAARREACLRMLERVRLPRPERALASFPHQFSGGMRQRIMLAAVMLLEPRLLIADEPTTALDVIVQREVLNLMVDIVRESGTGLLLITHDLGVVSEYADRVVVIDKGRIVESGSRQQVLYEPAHPYTRRLIAAIPGGTRTSLRKAGRREAPLVSASHVSVRYRVPAKGLIRRDEITAVDDVTLDIHPGETVALVGESGSGKSSLGRALLQLQPVTSGTVRFDGHELSGMTGRQLLPFRRRMQLVFQDPFSSLNPRLRVQGIIGEGLRLRTGLGRAQKLQVIREILREVELDPATATRFPHELSGGQRQRVCIARALVMEPDLIVADEPVSALDVTVQAQVLRLLGRLQEQRQFACLFISHDLAVVREMADRVIVMFSGCVVEEGSNEAVFERHAHPYTRDLLAATPRLERRATQAPERAAVSLPPSLEFLPISEIAGRSERLPRRRMHTLQPGHRVAVLEHQGVNVETDRQPAVV
ncbi:MAG TPA: ABC transporter ATP-binding protein [Woeseiaceae bacterium]|nr:ABC transporter ATP-binding protein [Woeseiaceae bacterium]